MHIHTACPHASICLLMCGRFHGSACQADCAVHATCKQPSPQVSDASFTCAHVCMCVCMLMSCLHVAMSVLGCLPVRPLCACQVAYVTTNCYESACCPVCKLSSECNNVSVSCTSVGAGCSCSCGFFTLGHRAASRASASCGTCFGRSSAKQVVSLCVCFHVGLRYFKLCGLQGLMTS